jgi:hypothetical protein
MRICCWCRCPVQPQPATPYCKTLGFYFHQNPFQCARGESPKGGINQRIRMRAAKYEPKTLHRVLTTGELLDVLQRPSS